MIVLKLCLAWPSHAHYVLRVCKSHSWKTKVQGSINHSHGQANLTMKASLFVIHFDHKPFLSIVMLVYYMLFLTGMTCQARTSYTEDEVLWGHRFLPVMSLEEGFFRVDYSQFHSTFEVPTPPYSVKEYEEKSSLLSPLVTPHRERVFSMDCLEAGEEGVHPGSASCSCPANSRKWARLVEKIFRGRCYAWARSTLTRLRARGTFLLNYSASAPALGMLTERHDSTSKPSRWVSSPWPCPPGTSTREVCLPPQRPSPHTPRSSTHTWWPSRGQPASQIKEDECRSLI